MFMRVLYQRAPPPPGHLPGSLLLRSGAAGCFLSSGHGGTAESSHTSQKIHIQGTEEENKIVSDLGGLIFKWSVSKSELA